MSLQVIGEEQFGELDKLHSLYKQEIGEEAPTETELSNLHKAIQNKQITFFGFIKEGQLAGICSVSKTFSTFNYEAAGVFEDFYILPKYRHQGIARQLVRYAYEQSKIGSMTVGSADCDVKMYQALGFTIPLGNLLAFDC